MNAIRLIPLRELHSFDQSDFIKQELPVLLKGGCREWPAFRKWTIEFFANEFGDVEVPMSNYKKDPYQAATTKPLMKIRDYLSIATSISTGNPSENENLYSAGWFFCRDHCRLLEDTITPRCFSENMAERAQKIIHFETRSIIFGHPKVESPLHTDSFFVSTWIAELKGQKRIRLVDPAHTQFVKNGFDVFEDENLRLLYDHDVPVYDAIIEEGDIVWFPPGWWHHVKNDTFTISLTTNFVHPYHFLPFEQQVRATLIKPLLRLNELKVECMRPILAGSNTHSKKVLEDSKFEANESSFISYFDQYLDFSKTVVATKF